MPSPKNSALADRVVRKAMADGTVKEYRYPRKVTHPARHPAGTLGAVLTAYKGSPEWLRKAAITRKTQTIYLKHLETAAHLPAVDIKRRLLLTLRDSIAAGSGPGAATMFVRCCSSLFAWAVDREFLENSPTIGIKSLPGGHLTAWTPDQAVAALAVLPEALRRAMVLAIYTGQRRGDLCRMTWANYDGQSIRMVQSKTARALVIPVHPTLKVELDTWRAEDKCAFILHTKYRKPWTPGSLTHGLSRELDSKKLPRLGMHGLRKLAAANLADAGCSTHEIAAITGHASLSMVQLYTASADQERLAEAAMTRLTTASDNLRQKSK